MALSSQFFTKSRKFRDNAPAVFADNNYPSMTMPVRLSSLQATQEGFDPKKVEKIQGSGDSAPIHLWKDSRGYRIIDGHHRSIAAMKRGDKTIMAHIWMEK